MEKREVSIWNEKELNQFLTYSKQGHTTYHMIYYLALYTGMRQGELLALQWKDIDLNKKKIHVRKSLIYPKKDTYIIDTPKTSSSIRKISISEELASALQEYKQYRKEYIENFEFEYDKTHDLVFANEIGKAIHPRSLTGHFYREIEKSGVPKIRFHDMRHTHASLLIKFKVPIKVVSERLGHSNASMTLDVYTHVFEDMQEDAANDYEARLKELSTSIRSNATLVVNEGGQE